MADRSNSVVVTGVSSGIGRAIAGRLIDDGWRVFGSVRKEEDAVAARQALGTALSPLILDVTDGDSIAAAADLVDRELAGTTLGGLVNNAGVAVAGPLRYLPIDDLKWQFDVNVYGVVRTIQAFLSMLGADHERSGEPGKIINVSSLAGKIAVPFLAPYAMSKHALEAMSDSLRVELLVHGIDVVVVEPGPVKTPIFTKTEELDFSRYGDSEYVESLERVRRSSQRLAEEGLDPEDIGELVVRILHDPSPKSRHPLLKNRFRRWIMPRLLPARVLDRVLARRTGITSRRRPRRGEPAPGQDASRTKD